MDDGHRADVPILAWAISSATKSAELASVPGQDHKP